MDLDRSIRRRRMVRAFERTPLPRQLVDEMLDLARRAPSAGNSQAIDYLVLDAPPVVEQYWETTFTPAKRASFRWQGLFDAPVLVVLTTRPETYVERYHEADKARPGLGDDIADWPVPYWWVDAGAVAQNLLLLAVDRGLGACLFGVFDHEAAVKTAFDIPEDRRIVATVALGHPLEDEPGRSQRRPRTDLSAIVHRGRWSASL